MELLDEDPSLLVLVLDFNHHAWTLLENLKRGQSDPTTMEELYSYSQSTLHSSSTNKNPASECTLNEFVNLLLIFIDSYLLCHRRNQICIMGAYDESAEFIYPPEVGMGNKSVIIQTEENNNDEETEGNGEKVRDTVVIAKKEKIIENELSGFNQSITSYEHNPRMKVISEAMGKAFEKVGKNYMAYHNKVDHINEGENDQEIAQKKIKELPTIESKYIVKALSKALCYTERKLRESGSTTERSELLPRILIAQVSSAVHIFFDFKNIINHFLHIVSLVI